MLWADRPNENGTCILTYPVDIRGDVGWEIVVDDVVHALEVHAPPHEVGGNEHPRLATSERIHSVFSLEKETPLSSPERLGLFDQHGIHVIRIPDFA